MYKGIKIRIYPNEKQKQQINMNFGSCRFVWNQMLAMQNERYKNGGKHVGKYDMQRLLSPLKKEYPWLKSSDADSLGRVCNDLEDAFQRFFKKINKYPRFKTKRFPRKSYTSTNHRKTLNNVNYSSIKILDLWHLQLPKVKRIRCCKLKKIPSGVIISATVRRVASGKYFAILMVDTKIDKLPKTQRIVGLDMGLSDLIITSDGVKYKTKHFDDEMARKIRLWERRFFRRMLQAKRVSEQEQHNFKKFGHYEDARRWYDFKNVQKARLMVAKLKEKVSNQRLNYIQNITTQLVRNYDEIKIEDLKTKNLMKNHRIAKSLSNQSWRMIRTQLEYKCDWYGKKLTLVNPYKTSQICSNCGYDDGFHGLYIRKWTCPKCHKKLDRDINAAKNIMMA